EVAPRELADEYRRAALRQEQESERSGQHRLAIDVPAKRDRAVVLLQADQLLAPLTIPVVAADEPLPREPPEPLDAVDVVKGRFRRLEVEVRPDPVHALGQRRVLAVDAALGGDPRSGVELLLALVEAHRRDEQPAHPSHAHADAGPIPGLAGVV